MTGKIITTVLLVNGNENENSTRKTNGGKKTSENPKAVTFHDNIGEKFGALYSANVRTNKQTNLEVFVLYVVGLLLRFRVAYLQLWPFSSP